MVFCTKLDISSDFQVIFYIKYNILSLKKKSMRLFCRGDTRRRSPAARHNLTVRRVILLVKNRRSGSVWSAFAQGFRLHFITAGQPSTALPFYGRSIRRCLRMACRGEKNPAGLPVNTVWIDSMCLARLHFITPRQSSPLGSLGCAHGLPRRKKIRQDCR